MPEQTSPAPWRLGYRPELDGLRAVAIGMVMFMHATGYGRGPVGVTVFFTLSGFLITALLCEERARTGRVDLLAFYRRRARRLLPALCVALAIVGAYLLLSGRTAELPRTVIPPLFYFSNFVNLAGSNAGIMGHTWSLAIEEQFYIVWPVTLIAAFAFAGRRAALVVALGGAVISLALRLALTDPANTNRAFFGSDTNADSILLGCALALVMTGFVNIRVPRWASLVAVLAIVLPFVAPLDEVTALTVGQTAVGIGTTVAIAALVTMPHRHPLLAWGPLVALGRISYGLYIVHLPIMFELRPLLEREGVPLPIRAAVAIAVSISAAVALWLVVERRFLARAGTSRARSTDSAATGEAARAAPGMSPADLVGSLRTIRPDPTG